jgi:hypothetical protein
MINYKSECSCNEAHECGCLLISWERQDAYRAGYSDALEDARAAVDSISPIDQQVYEGFISLVYDKGEILAAIDELRKRP